MHKATYMYNDTSPPFQYACTLQVPSQCGHCSVVPQPADLSSLVLTGGQSAERLLIPGRL